MLSMCSLVCRLVRGWKQSEATTLISQAATTPGSSLLLHDLSEPELNVDVGSYIASPYPHFDGPHKFSRKGSCSDCNPHGSFHPAFCQAFAWPERNIQSMEDGKDESMVSSFRPSLFCQQGCAGDREGEGSCGLLHPPPRVQVIWCDNNRQASLVTPRQFVDLSRWTLFFASQDDLLEHRIHVPPLPVPPASKVISDNSKHSSDNSQHLTEQTSSKLIKPATSNIGVNGTTTTNAVTTSTISTTSDISSKSLASSDGLESSMKTSSNPTGSRYELENPDTSMETSPFPRTSDMSSCEPDQSSGSGLKMANVSHGFGPRKTSGTNGKNGSLNEPDEKNTFTGDKRNEEKNIHNGTNENCYKTLPNGGFTAKSGVHTAVSEHISVAVEGAAFDGVRDTAELVTVLLEARCISNQRRARDDACKAPVMVDQVCKAYAWKCRGVFGVIAHTTPRRLMLMVDAFFANNLLLDSDLHVTKILTVDCVGVPGRLTDPGSIAECATPGGYYTTAKQHQHTSLLDAARCLSAADVSRAPSPGPSPISEAASPVPLLEEVLEERDSTHSSVSPEPSSLPFDLTDQHFAEDGTKNSRLQESAELTVNSEGPSGVSGSEQLNSTSQKMSSGQTENSDGVLGCGSVSNGVAQRDGNKASSDDVNKTCDDSVYDFTKEAPNILVYANNNEAYFDSVKKTLLSCLKKDRYVIYHLTSDTAFRSPWVSNTTLLVICGDVQAHVSTVFIRYLLQGGRVLSICSDFLNVAVPLFGTVEVAESAVVGVRYGRWGSVQFLHHQHCSHSSPQSNRFSTHLDLDDKPGTSCKRGRGGTVSVEPTHVEIRDTDGRAHVLQLHVLATDDTWGAPSLIGARVRGGRGRGVFSQVHLERGPMTPGTDVPVGGDKAPRGTHHEWDQRGARARREILRDLLSTELLLETEQDERDEWADGHTEWADEQSAGLDAHEPCYSPAVLLGDQRSKEGLLAKLRPKLLGGKELHRPQLRLVFVSFPDGDATEASADVLPVLLSPEAPTKFNKEAYYAKLQTKEVGRLVMYCDVMTSSMHVVEGATLLTHGLAVVPRRQSKGTGRGGNAWLSPEGCMMFSLQLHLPMASFMGSHLPLIQHLVSVAVVMSMSRDHPGLQLSLKWPNDIYAGPSKLGGVLVQSSLTASTACVNLGVGVNLNNDAPTTSVLQLLRESDPACPPVSVETSLAATFNAIEELINLVETEGPEPFIQIYYSYWKHSGAQVTVLPAEDGRARNAAKGGRTVTITGIDYYGFLKGVDCVTREAVSIQPDGNSFNMMENLVYSKNR